MPCFSDYGRFADQDCYDKLKAATRAACEMARAIRSTQHGSTLYEKLSSRCRKWIIEHEKMDAARIKREKENHKRKKLKKQVLKKLTKQEREALGL